MTDLLSPETVGAHRVGEGPTENLIRHATFHPLPRPEVTGVIYTKSHTPRRSGVVMPEGFQPPTTPDVPRPSLPPTPPPPTPNAGQPNPTPMPVPLPPPPPKVDETARLTLLDSLAPADDDLDDVRRPFFQTGRRRMAEPSTPVWGWRAVSVSGWVLAALVLAVALSGCRVLQPSPQTPGSTYRVPDAGMPRPIPTPPQNGPTWIGGVR